jgi:endonuclease/exonuclease/phosphatase family metal-dependent hydrolase
MPGSPAMNRVALLIFGLLFGIEFVHAEAFRIATYNLENYLDEASGTRHAKPAEAKTFIRQSIIELKPDVIALQETGSSNAVFELQQSLEADGLHLPHLERVSGFDTNIHLAVLSRFPFSAHRPHTNDDFLLDGRRFQVSRGFAEVDIQVATNFSFTLIAAHLKSKRPVAIADEADLRFEEARLLREIVDQRFAADPNARLVVLGDFNDTRNSKAIHELIGRGKHKLVDTRPSEPNGDNPASDSASHSQRNITWTHYYSIEDTYSRIDYILLSPAMNRFWKKEGTYVLTMPNWGRASDHRPIVAAFDTEVP